MLARLGFQFLDLAPAIGSFRDEVLSGLARSPKQLPPKYFYDAEAIREEAEYGRVEYPNASTRSDRKASSSAMYRNVGNAYESVERGFDQTARIVDPSAGRNRRSVWTVATAPFSEAHFATFPPALIEPCILAGCPKSGCVLDPFAGAGTTGLVALRHDRDFIGIELNPDYAQMARNRIYDDGPLLNVEQ